MTVHATELSSLSPDRLESLIGSAFFAAAIDDGDGLVIACEVNYDPPNPASDAFHEKLGFEEVGRAYLAERGKRVRYLHITVTPPLPTD